jgi:DNA-binding transcriptional LysR family regulator
VRLAGIDLNLLTSLDALLEERNVTRAAGRLGLTQPAVSHSLRRLRDLLGDELLVRTPHGMRPTPRALELRPAVRAALDAAEAVLQAAPAFDPRRAERRFTVAVIDQAAFQLMPQLVERLTREAPGVRIDVPPMLAGRFSDALAGELDLAIGVFFDSPAGIREQHLWREEFVCVVRRGSRAARGRFDLRRYLSLPHIVVTPRGGPGSPVDDALAATGQRRSVVMTTPHFLLAPQIVATTDLVWTAPGGLASAFAGQLPLTVRDVPLPLSGFDVAMRWHIRLDRDPGLAWLRTMLRAAAPA